MAASTSDAFHALRRKESSYKRPRTVKDPDSLSSKTVAPSDAVQASKRKYKRARTTATVQDPSGSEMLFMIYAGYGLTINAVDENGALIPRYCIKAQVYSVPSYMGLTVIGSDLHMFGGILGDKLSIDTYTLDLRRIPQALDHGRGILELCVCDPQQMIDHKTTPIVYHARGCIYVISICIDVQMPIRADCTRDGQRPGRDIEYRPFPFKPDAPWSGLDRPPIPPELGPVFIHAHALSADHNYIAISLTNNKGAYILSLDSHTWIPLETGPLCFTNQPALLPSREGIYISPSKSKLRVFDDILSSPIGKLRIRGVSRCILHATTHQVAVMGGVVFIIRCGSSRRQSDCKRAAYMTIDTYVVSPSGDHITAQLCLPKLLLDAFHPRGPIADLHCFPVRLSG